MKYFVGIVPPENIYNTITNIQQQFGDNRLEPHITLRPPVAPTDLDSWLENITSISTSFCPFQIHLPCTGYFGKRVLFIKVQSVEINQFQSELVAAIKPFEPLEKEDSRGYNPHLTLGRNWCGFTKQDFEEMQQLTDKYLSAEPVIFKVEFIRVYHKPQSNKRYEKLVDLPLQ